MHPGIIQKIVKPRHEDTHEILNDLDLDLLPGSDKINEAVQSRLLLPSEKIPLHWLTNYQR